MAHFAELDDNNIVKRVIVVSNKDTADETGIEREEIGVAFCAGLFGGRWVQTSYNANFRKKFAGAGDTYDTNLDAFLPPKPDGVWILDETCNWVSPHDLTAEG